MIYLGVIYEHVVKSRAPHFPSFCVPLPLWGGRWSAGGVVHLVHQKCQPLFVMLIFIVCIKPQTKTFLVYITAVQQCFYTHINVKSLVGVLSTDLWLILWLRGLIAFSHTVAANFGIYILMTFHYCTNFSRLPQCAIIRGHLELEAQILWRKPAKNALEQK